MKAFTCLLAVFCVILAAVYAEEDDGGQYTSTVIDKPGGEEDVEIRDSDGKLVSTAELFLDSGYQIEKPADRLVCLFRMSNDSSTCYEEKPFTSAVTTDLAARCEGRELVTLVPISCEDSPVEEIARMLGGRSKRSTWNTCCRWTYTKSTKCQYDKCCSSFLGICFSRCCQKYYYEVIWSKKCTTGYTSTFTVNTSG